MGRKLSDIASRFKAAIDQEAIDKEEASVREARELEAARAARAAFLTELTEFAKLLPGLKAKQGKDGAVTLTREEYKVTFSPEGEGDRVAVDYPAADEGEHLFRAYEDGEEVWVLSTNRRQVPLLDEGFEDICVNGLGLPRPDGSTKPAPAAAAKAPAKGHRVNASGGEASVKEALKQRRLEQRAARPRPTKIMGGNHAPWDIRPTNPGKKAVVAHVDDPNRTHDGEAKDEVWGIRTEHTEKENPRRKRKFVTEDAAPVGSMIKKYKPIID